MDNPKRQLLALALMGVIIAGFYGYTTLTAPEADQSTQASPAEGEQEPGESETSDEEPNGLAEREAPPIPAGLRDTPLVSGPSTAQERDRRRERLEGQHTFAIETEAMRAELSNLNTGLVSVVLKEERFRGEDGQRLNLVTTDKERFFPSQLKVEGVDIPDDAIWEGEQLSATSVRFTWEGDNMRVARRIEAGSGPYQLWSTVEVRNLDNSSRYARPRYFTHHYVSSEDESAGFIGRPSPLMSSGVCRHEDTTERETSEDLLDPRGFGGPVRFTGVHNTYFANVLVSPEGAERCVLATDRRGVDAEGEPLGTLFQVELRLAGEDLDPGATQVTRVMTYFGPTDRDALRQAGNSLSEVIDLGWFSFIANGLIDLLRWIHSHIGDWGLAIILLTLLVKLLFYPLTVRSFRAMARMRILKPEIDKINEKYADNRELKGQAVMELYRKHKVNPASGCLPSLLQMPVWFALYRSLSTNLELYHAPFLLWSDLSSSDPYFILPGLVAVLMHLQQRLTPTTMDPAQAKMMMYLMPIMIGSFMLFLPAGLCLYMVTNSVLTIVQQKLIYSKLDREEAAAKAQPKAIEESEDDPDEDPGPVGEPIPAGATAGESSSRRRTVRSRNRKKRQRRG